MLRCVTCARREVIGLMSASLKQKATGPDEFDLVRMTIDCTFAKIIDMDKQVVGGVVVREEGDTLWVVAAAGLANVKGDMTDAIDNFLNAAGRDFHQVGFRTRRRGLMRKAIDRGYAITGMDGDFTLLRKTIQC
jgi:hypothetical protein